MQKKVIAILIVVVLIVAAAAVAVFVINDKDDREKGGLYSLDATVLNVDMGGMSSTPKMVETIKYMYAEVSGDLADGAGDLTISDAKKDSAFWKKYCTWDSLVTVNADGSITYKTPLDEKTSNLQNVTIPGPATRLIASGTAYATTVYYCLCYKYGVEPFSSDAFANRGLVDEFQSMMYAGLNLDAIRTSSEELAKYYPGDYIESCSSLKSYDREQLGKDVKGAVDDGNGGNIVVLMGSATIAKDSNAAINQTVTENGGYMMLNRATSISSTLAGVEMVATILGLGDNVDRMVENMELELYKIYWSSQKGTDKHKAYFETSSAKASGSSGSAVELCNFLGWDTSLFTGKEIDTETLLLEKPDIMIYYTNDDRSLDEKMRVTS